MTELTIRADQMQSTPSVLKMLRASVGQSTKEFLPWRTESYTVRSTEVVYVLHPLTKELVEVSSEQLWFWTEDWQEKERQVEEDLASGDYEDFDTMDDFFADM